MGFTTAEERAETIRQRGYCWTGGGGIFLDDLNAVAEAGHFDPAQLLVTPEGGVGQNMKIMRVSNQ